MVGLFETVASPGDVEGIPEDFCFGDIPPDWDRMHAAYRAGHAARSDPARHRHQAAVLRSGVVHARSQLPHGRGAQPQGFFVAAGFNSLGILSGGGAGLVMAHWIVDGHAPMDVWSVNLRRMHAWQDNDRYLPIAPSRSLGIGYQDHWPFRQWQSARDVKKSILHDRLAAAGACFGESAGWERPNWYARRDRAPRYEYSWGRQNWFENNAEEHRAVRERVGLFEQSSFAKLLVQGRDAETRAQPHRDRRLSRAGRARASTRSSSTQRGGIEADLTITRLARGPLPGRHRRLHADTRRGVDPQSHRRRMHSAWSPTSPTPTPMLNVQGPPRARCCSSVSPDDFSQRGLSVRDLPRDADRLSDARSRCG